MTIREYFAVLEWYALHQYLIDSHTKRILRARPMQKKMDSNNIEQILEKKKSNPLPLWYFIDHSIVGRFEF